MSDQDEQENGIKAITALLEVLGPLKPETRSNVLDYVFRALGIALPGAPITPPSQTVAAPNFIPPPAISVMAPGVAADIRTLAEQKKPKTNSQMVAIMAYYLSTHAPQAERRDYIASEDIKRYFPQANFPLPTGRPDVTLNNAKVAGYLDAIGDGQYRLNPVGHNLVVHKLPLPDGGIASSRVSRKGNKGRKKKARK